MLLGMDVGGTYTDAALYEQGRILKISKRPTQQPLQKSLLNAIQELLGSEEAQGKNLRRIVISTTHITNLLATKQGAPTALILLPGHSLPHESYQISKNQFFLDGMVDFRGRIVEKISKEALENCLSWLAQKNFSHVAVAGKFSNRNPALEREVATAISNRFPWCTVLLSHQVSARLNFPRRATTAYYTAMVQTSWKRFAQELQTVLTKLNIHCDVQVLKADGGTLPLPAVEKMPCETIFSGPAASVMGALALHPDVGNAVVLDVGGTTCDLALIVDGKPLYASRGAKIAGLATQIDAFSVDSIPLGGDSSISVENGQVVIHPYRKGPALCFGGNTLTLTDVMNDYHAWQLGNFAASRQAVSALADQASLPSQELGEMVENAAVSQLLTQIRRMFQQWEKEPAYKVWEVVHRQPFHVQKLIGLGAGAPLLLPALAKRLQVPFVLSPYAASANAIGAALARPTLRVTLHADTITQQVTLSPPTLTQPLPKTPRLQLAQVKEMALKYLKERCQVQQIPFKESDAFFFLEEQFNVLSGWGESSGRIFDVGVQIQSGFIDEFTGVIS